MSNSLLIAKLRVVNKVEICAASGGYLEMGESGYLRHQHINLKASTAQFYLYPAHCTLAPRSPSWPNFENSNSSKGLPLNNSQVIPIVLLYYDPVSLTRLHTFILSRYYIRQLQWWKQASANTTAWTVRIPYVA